MRPERLIGGAVAVTLAVFLAGWIAAPFDTFQLWATNLGWLSIALLAGVAGLNTARTSPRGARRPWLFLALGSFAWSFGQAYWTWSALSGRDEFPFPAWSDVGYLAAMPLLAAGVLTWPRRRRITRTDVLDALVGALIGALVVFEFAIEPIFVVWEWSLVDWVSLAYPVGEAVVIVPAVIGLLLNVWADRARIFAVALGLIALASADAAFSIAAAFGNEYSGAFDPVWAIAFALLAVAAIIPRGRRVPRVRRIPPSAYVAVVTAALASVAIADAVEAPDEVGAGWPASYAIAVLLVFGITRVLALARAREHDATRLRHAKSALERSQGARDKFMVQLVNSQERDSRKIADLLHDDVVQQLTALQFRLELQSQRLEEPSLRELAVDSSEIIASIRRLLVELHPAILDSQGLAPAVDVVADTLRDRGIDVRVTPFPHRLSREHEVLAYRLVQEALTNVERHSGADYAEVEFGLDHDVLRGRISDTGPGAGAPVDEDVGLMVARERVELAGGTFHVSRREPAGTDVRFELPIAPTREEVAA